MAQITSVSRNQDIARINITSTLSGGASIFEGSSVQCSFPPLNSTSYTVSVRGKTKTAKLLTILDSVCVYLCVCLEVWGRRKGGRRGGRQGGGGRRMEGVEEGRKEGITLTCLFDTALVILYYVISCSDFVGCLVKGCV